MDNAEYEVCTATGKKCYSEKQANISLSYLRKKHRDVRCSNNGKIPRRKYLCEYCGYWHLTSHITDFKNKQARRKKRYIKTIW